MQGEEFERRKFKKGECGNPNGRPPKLCKKIMTIPKDAQEMVYATLYEAMTCSTKADAKKCIEAADWGDFGFIKQIALKSLMGDHGWQVLNDIMDRLFGRPKMSIEQEIDTKVNVITQEELDKDIEDLCSRLK